MPKEETPVGQGEVICYLQIHHGQLYQNASQLQNAAYKNPRHK
jgi:hypothetical protein